MEKEKKKKKTIYFDESTILEITQMCNKYKITQRQLIKDALKALREKVAGRF